MDFTPSHAQQIARLKAETRLIRKKRYNGMIGIMLGVAGVAAMAAGLPDLVSFGFWGIGAIAWRLLKAA